MPCPPGKFCEDGKEKGLCKERFYCPQNQSVADPAAFMCPAGTFCRTGFPLPQQCPPGTFTNATGQKECQKCPKGKVCEPFVGPVTNPRPCPSGFFCPAGTKRRFQYRCPVGTYGSDKEPVTAKDCRQCLAGYGCTATGLPSPLRPCLAGFYCEKGSAVTNPNNTLCPAGSYCPEGSKIPTPCKGKMFSNRLGAAKSSECDLCPDGHYCTVSGSATTILPCKAGFVCFNGSDVANPTDRVHGYRCPKKHYCPEGSKEPYSCPPGTFADIEGLGACKKCTVGHHCPNPSMEKPLPCPKGYYCDTEGIWGLGTPCPRGRFNVGTGKSKMEECALCSKGRYCDRTGIDRVPPPCKAGFICFLGSTSAFPSKEAGVPESAGRPCRPGFYCPDGKVETPCPDGTFREASHAAHKSECHDCPGGFYCDPKGDRTKVTERCAAGYFCPGKATARKPKTVCGAGFKCPEGTAHPVPCEPGYFQEKTKQAKCDPCRAGFHCFLSPDKALPCPNGHYCPEGAVAPIRCPVGFYAPDPAKPGLRVKKEDCSICPAGRYCSDGRITGKCKAGYLCSLGASGPDSSSDPNPKHVVPCPKGLYCEEGVIAGKPCPAGTFPSVSRGAFSKDQCDICPEGNYCPPNAKEPQTCLPGKYCRYGQNMTDCPR